MPAWSRLTADAWSMDEDRAAAEGIGSITLDPEGLLAGFPDDCAVMCLLRGPDARRQGRLACRVAPDLAAMIARARKQDCLEELRQMMAYRR